jgi:hypothetical protein
MEDAPIIKSFVIRFIIDAPDTVNPTFRGAITHVQTNEEIQFRTWQDAEQFMKRFVPNLSALQTAAPPPTNTLPPSPTDL